MAQCTLTTAAVFVLKLVGNVWPNGRRQRVHAQGVDGIICSRRYRWVKGLRAVATALVVKPNGSLVESSRGVWPLQIVSAHDNMRVGDIVGRVACMAKLGDIDSGDGVSRL